MTLFYTPYERRLKTPFQNASFSIVTRKGLLFKSIEGAKTYYSEASPLPNYSSESYEELLEKKDCPSLRFALSMLKEETLSKSLSLSAVLGLSQEKEGSTLLKKGFQTLKLKIAPETQEKCLQLLHVLSKTFPHIKIRLDANSRFTLEEAKRLCDKLLSLPIEYLEDPLQDITEIQELKKTSPLHTALDQPLLSLSDLSMALNLPFEYLILKPSTLGSKEEIQGIVTKIRLAKKKFIFSSLFESEIGLRKLYLMASSFQEQEAHGLATAQFLENNFFNDEALIHQIPPYSLKEEQYLNSLSWKEWEHA